MNAFIWLKNTILITKKNAKIFLPKNILEDARA
jgi:hypothetical protein